MDKNVEHAKKLKEIADIIAERDELERLLKENNEIKLSEHLAVIGKKHSFEKFLYNLGKPNPPKPVREDAINCLAFLNKLLLAKEFDMINTQMC